MNMRETGKNSVLWKSASVLMILACLLVLLLSLFTTNTRGLSANADYTESQTWNFSYRNVSSWDIEDNYTISHRYYISPTSATGYILYNKGVFNGSASSYELEYYVIIYQYNTNTKLLESEWMNINEEFNFAAFNVTQTNGFAFRIYVRRKEDANGNRGYLVPSDMNPSSVVFYGTRYFTIEQQTLPADWFATTTATYQTVATTTVVDPAYNTQVGTVPPLDSNNGAPPSWFNSFDVRNITSVFSNIGQFALIYTRVASDLGFIWILCGFFIIGGLLGWLLH